jgi:hypothetical protein
MQYIKKFQVSQNPVCLLFLCFLPLSSEGLHLSLSVMHLNYPEHSFFLNQQNTLNPSTQNSKA